MERRVVRLSRAGRLRTHPAHEVELRLPSELGYEKVAMDTVGTLAGRMGFAQDRVAALRTAIAEAVTNAIEHGNRGMKDAIVRVQIVPGCDRLTVVVHDLGGNRLAPGRVNREPSLSRAMDGSDEGWGMWLIQQLVDEASWSVSPGGGNEVRLVLYAGTGSDRPGGGAHGISG